MNKGNLFETINILQLLKNGTLDVNRGQLYKDSCYVLTGITDQEMREGESLFRYPTRIDLFGIVLCEEGEITLTSDLQQLTIGANTLFVARPGAIVHVTSARNCRLSIFLTSGEFNEQLNISIQKIIPHAQIISQAMSQKLSPEQFHYVKSLISIVSDTIAQPTHLSYYNETVQAAVRTFTYSLLSIWVQYLEETELQHVQSHQEELFRHFIRLVTEHYREERKISFYADRMCLTPKYLSKIIRDTSGHSPSEWIDNLVVLESKNLLKYSSLSIQEVAYTLHFPNQSFFGRWFKSHTGLSPKSYRDSK